MEHAREPEIETSAAQNNSTFGLLADQHMHVNTAQTIMGNDAQLSDRRELHAKRVARQLESAAQPKHGTSGGLKEL